MKSLNILNVPNPSDCFLDALACKPTSKTPVWLMRQAGRYLPEYREIRAQAGDFLTLLKTPKLAVEVTLQPIRRFDLDAAILFSDILTIPDAMGLELAFEAGEGPFFKHPLGNPHDIDRLESGPLSDRLEYVWSTIRGVKSEIAGHKPLIGFAASPWTLACYMIGEGPRRDFEDALRWLYQYPEDLSRLLFQLAERVGDYLIHQIDAGVDVIMIFDSWGGLLPSLQYSACGVDPVRLVLNRIQTVHPDIPTILFARGVGCRLERVQGLPIRCLALDSMVELREARRVFGRTVALQGNLDPHVLYGTHEEIRKQVRIMIQSLDDLTGFVFNLGHGIRPDVDFKRVGFLIDCVHQETRACSENHSSPIQQM